MHETHAPRPAAGWRRSSYCNGAAACVEVTHTHVDDTHLVLVRDAKEQDGPILFFTPEEWVVFLSGVRAGEFDPQALGVMPGGGEDGSPRPSEVPVGEIRPPQVSR